MAKSKSSSQYDALLDDLVDNYIVDMSEVYSQEDFEGKLKRVDTKNRFSKGLFNVLFGRPKTQDIIDDNVNREKITIQETFLTLETSSEVDTYAENIRLRNNPQFKEFVKTEQKKRKSVTARRERVEQNIEIRKQDLFQNAERRITLGNYQRWSAVQRQFQLTDEELNQLQIENPQIQLR